MVDLRAAPIDTHPLHKKTEGANTSWGNDWVWREGSSQKVVRDDAADYLTRNHQRSTHRLRGQFCI